MADITMSLDDTLELDTIIRESTDATTSITVKDGTKNTDFNLKGIETHTGIFSPINSGVYNLDVNGQELTVEVTDPTNTPKTTDPTNIPKTSVSRPADDLDAERTVTCGLKFATSQSWTKIQGRYSNGTANATKAYLTDTNQTVIETVDVSGLTSGDVFTFSQANLSKNTSYYMYMDAEGSSFSGGFYSEPRFPYTSSDGNLEITAGLLDGEEQGSIFNISCISEIGNLNL